MKSKSYCSLNDFIVVYEKIDSNCCFFKDNNFLHFRITRSDGKSVRPTTVTPVTRMRVFELKPYSIGFFDYYLKIYLILSVISTL